jgi:hypothetical protein
MLPVVVTAGMLLNDLASPLTPEEYTHHMLWESVWHEPLPPEVREHYFAKGRLLAGFLYPGMTAEEVRGVVSVRANGWVQEGGWWTHTYSLLGLTVRYRVSEVAGESRPWLVVEEVEATPP